MKPPDTNPLTAAGRYGFRGSKDIVQFTTKFHEVGLFVLFVRTTVYALCKATAIRT